MNTQEELNCILLSHAPVVPLVVVDLSYERSGIKRGRDGSGLWVCATGERDRLSKETRW
jgi:hypothetical protein